MEVLDSFAQLYGDVGQHSLEVTEGLAHDIRTFRSYCALRNCVGDEDHDAPVFLAVEVEILAVLGRHEVKYFALQVSHVCGFVFGTDVIGHSHDIVHQHLDIGEDGVVDVLQDVVGGIALGFYFVGSVDQTVSQRTYVDHFALNVKISNDLLQICFHSIRVNFGLLRNS